MPTHRGGFRHLYGWGSSNGLIGETAMGGIKDILK